jgi:hypothetical protein
MSKNAMRADLSRQMKKTTNQHARIPHIGKSGTRYEFTWSFEPAEMLQFFRVETSLLAPSIDAPLSR